MLRHSLLPLALSTLLLAPLQQARDLSKRQVELPLERALERAAEPHAPEGARTPSSGRVAPGLVRWHADLESACAAARVSGKPVLLFQLLGRLDDELC